VSQKKYRNFSGFEFPTKPPFRTLVNKTSTTSTDKGKLIDILIRVSGKLSASFYHPKKSRSATKNGYIMQVGTTFCRNGKCYQKAKTKDKPRKNKMYDSEKEKHLKKDI
jgi:hypothetical protein